jgi:hypothetical protein
MAILHSQARKELLDRGHGRMTVVTNDLSAL